jgi:DNA invertase Pin-like site-specific DNA recombinase
MQLQCVLLLVDGANRDELVRLAGSRRWQVRKTLEGSRASSRQRLDELRRLAHQEALDCVVVDTVRLPGVGIRGLLRELSAFAQLGIDVASRAEPWLSTIGATGDLIRWVDGCLDEEHRARVRGALAKVRAGGKRLGRPRATIPVETVVQMRTNGASLRAIARATGLGVSTIQRFLAERRPLIEAAKAKDR